MDGSSASIDLSKKTVTSDNETLRSHVSRAVDHITSSVTPIGAGHVTKFTEIAPESLVEVTPQQ